MNTFIFYSVCAVVLPLLGFAYLRERHWRRRETAIRRLLDSADALEQQLHECRERMQGLREMLVDLPEEMISDADFALAADHKVQAALRDLLQHRLWIKQNAIDASQDQLDTAVAAIAQSRESMGKQLDRLAEIATELRAAQSR